MRIIAVKTLKEYWEEFPQAEQPSLSWYEEVEAADWNRIIEMRPY